MAGQGGGFVTIYLMQRIGLIAIHSVIPTRRAHRELLYFGGFFGTGGGSTWRGGGCSWVGPGTGMHGDGLAMVTWIREPALAGPFPARVGGHRLRL